MVNQAKLQNHIVANAFYSSAAVVADQTGARLLPVDRAETKVPVTASERYASPNNPFNPKTFARLTTG